MHRIVERRPGRWHLESDGPGCTGRHELTASIGRQRQAPPIVLPGFAACLRALAVLPQPVAGAEALVGVSVAKEPIGCRAIPLQPLRLKVGRMWSADVWALIPRQPEPPKTLEDAGHHVGRRTFGIRV